MKKRKICLFFILIFITIFFKTTFSFAATHTYPVFTPNDFVFYDPISTEICNEKNYWTPYNQNTTCYRFIVLTKNDTQNNSQIKIMLDHSVDNNKYHYSDYPTVLNNLASKWTKYNGTIDIINLDTISNITEISDRPTLQNNNVATYFSYFTINSNYINNSNGQSDNGFWIKDSYDNNYAYGITETANIKLFSKANDILGIRPVLTIDKNSAHKSQEKQKLIINTPKYAYHLELQNQGISYSQLQGFTITDNNLIFYSSNSNNPNGGFISIANHKTQSSTVNSQYYSNTGHGNDMTYNSNTNTVLLTGVNDYKTISEYNANDMSSVIRQYSFNENYSAIGYDSNTDLYAILSNGIIYIGKLDSTTGTFKKMFSFSFPHNEIDQGLEYHNGYVYISSWKWSDNDYQKYVPYGVGTSFIYVYNAKLFKKSDNTYISSENFGKLAKTIYIDPYKYIESDYQELESVSFYNQKMYLGCATSDDTVNAQYRFYEVDENNVSPKTIAGDFNSNGFADIGDARNISEYIVNKNNISTDKYNIADYNKDGIVKMNDVMYMLKEDITTGFEKIDDEWYYRNEAKTMTTGWKQINYNNANSWFYFNGGGLMLKNICTTIDSTEYCFNSSGVCTSGSKCQ